jgi:hypothetical protein
MMDYKKNKMCQEYLLCAAIHYQDGKKHVYQPKNIETGFVVAGRRHSNCIITVDILTHSNPDLQKDSILPRIENTQGFVTNEDRFVDRKEGWSVAVASGQIKFDDKENILFSEDLY